MSLLPVREVGTLKEVMATAGTPGNCRSEDEALTNVGARAGHDIASASAIDRAINRVLAEIHDGLRHGYFEFTLTCDIVNHGRRRLTLRAGKNHQFLIPECDCLPSAGSIDSCDGSDSSS